MRLLLYAAVVFGFLNIRLVSGALKLSERMPQLGAGSRHESQNLAYSIYIYIEYMMYMNMLCKYTV